MNLDFIEIAKFLNKDKLCLDYLQKNATYEWGVKYYFGRCNKIEILHKEALNQVIIRGSIPYFINGHNYYASLPDWLEGLEYIQGCLKTNIFTGLVTCFEFGTIQEIPFNESDFLLHHLKAKEMQTVPYYKGGIITGKEFHSPSLKVKLYDVQRNIKNKLDKAIREELSRLYSWDKEKHYIKVENHYRKPDVHFKGNLYLNELVSSDFQLTLIDKLIHSYRNIMKAGTSIVPSHKADINAGTIPLMILKELESVYNFDTEELIKWKLRSFPEDVFSPV